MIRFYILPLEIASDGMRVPRYFLYDRVADHPGIDCRWQVKPYGKINMGVIVADISDTDHTSLIAHADVFSIGDLDTAIGQASLSALTTFLESVFIPADWMNAADTWRVVLRTITGMFLFMQRLTSITGDNPLDWGIALNTRFSQLDTAYQNAINQAYTDLGYNNSVIRTNWTMRVLLKNTADQWGARPIYFGFTTL